MKSYISNCCKSTVKVVGDTTKSHVCINCEKPCDVITETSGTTEEALNSISE